MTMPEFTVSNDLMTQPEALRARACEDGYLFFRALVAPEALANVRRQILALCAEVGWLRPGTDAEEGLAAPGVAHVEGEAAFNDLYYKHVLRLEDFHALAHHPALIATLDALFGEPTLVHPRNIARIIFPQAAQFTTPAHQDYIHIQGTEETWTAWMPLSDCPQELGSLAVLPGSHRRGVYPVEKRLGAGGMGINEETLPGTWRASDFRVGDVLLFYSLSVHKGLPNVTPDRMRLSVDFRYQGISQPVTEGSLLPHGNALTWDEVYADWSSKDWQYYWTRTPLNLVPFTHAFYEAAGREEGKK